MNSSIKKNFIYNIAYQVLTIVLPLATAPYLSRVLGPSQLGDYSYSYSVANYFMLFAMLGVNNYGNRCIARVRGDRAALSKEFWGIYAFQFSTAIVMCGVYAVYSIFISNNALLALVWLPYVLSAGLDINWFFFGLEEFRTTVARNFLVKLTTFALTFVLVRGEHALCIYCSLVSASFLVSAAALWPFVRRYVDWDPPAAREVIVHIKPNLVLFVPVVAVSLYTVMDRIMIGWLSTSEQNGYFENAYKVATMPFTLISALGTVMLPRISNLLSSGRRREAKRYLGGSMWVAMVLSFAFSFGVAGIAPVLTPVYFGEGFGPCELVMCVIVADMPFMAWANVLRTQLLIPEARDRDYVSSVVMGAAVNVMVNLVLIPRFGALGAAFGTLSAEAAVCIVQAHAVRVEVPQGKWLRDCLPFAGVGLAMFGAVRWIGEVAGASITTLIIQVLVGATIYAALSWLWCVATRDDNYREIVLPVMRNAMERVRAMCGYWSI